MVISIWIIILFYSTTTSIATPNQTILTIESIIIGIILFNAFDSHGVFKERKRIDNGFLFHVLQLNHIVLHHKL